MKRDEPPDLLQQPTPLHFRSSWERTLCGLLWRQRQARQPARAAPPSPGHTGRQYGHGTWLNPMAIPNGGSVRVLRDLPYHPV